MAEPQDKSADDKERIIRKELAQIYTPGIPIIDPKLFSGRKNLLHDLAIQLDIPGKVLILYGDRGVGKTSFCNILLHGRKAVRYSCTPDDNFVTIFLNILRQIGLHLTDEETSQLLEIGYEVGAKGAFKVADKETTERKFKPIATEQLDQAGVLRRLSAIQHQVDAIVFDEVQYLKDEKVHGHLETLLKMFSDNRVSIKVLFVGIAESDEDLLPPTPDYAEYKLRHYTTARIPPMSEAEIHDIIDRRKNLFNVDFDMGSKRDIAKISVGYPSIAHTLALYSCVAWLTTNVGKLLKNWVLKIPLIGRWLGSSGLRVENINMRIERSDFLHGVRTFLREFLGNYPRAAQQLANAFSPDERKNSGRLLTFLAETRGEAIAPDRLAIEFGADATDQYERLLGRCPDVIESDKQGYLKLAFSRLGAVVFAWDLLLREAPKELEGIVANPPSNQ